MKKLLLLLAVTLAFTFTALAQSDTSQAGGTSGQTSTTTKTKTKKSKSADQSGGAAAGEQGAAKTEGAGKAKKENTLTGCISAQPDANGNYTLTNGRYKNGIEIGPTDKVKEHAGHQVQLKGELKTVAGETAGGGATKAAAKSKSKSFEVASVKHLSDTCKEAPGGGTAGETKKGEKEQKKGKAKAATPPGF